MNHKRLGVIGGMGPKATAVFFDRIVDCTDASSDQDHIDIVILNHATLPDRTSIILSGQDKVFLEAISKDLKMMELAGVSNIAIPCNTSHYFFKQMQEATSVNLINMVDETLKEIHARYGDNAKVGLLATKGTVNSGIYGSGCESYGMKLHVPSEAVQGRVMDIIYNDVKSNANVDPGKLEAVIGELMQQDGCDCVIIACTELSCIKLSEAVKRSTVDAMEMLVRRSIELSGKQYVAR